MKEQLKRVLKKSPAIYQLAEKSYSSLSLSLRRLKLGLLGTKVLEREWATRHLRRNECDDWGNREGDWIKGYRDSRNHSHRAFLIEKISSFPPISSILEIGCNCGPNLYLLAKKFPDAEIRGIDINPMAVQKGNEQLAQEYSNVKLLVGKADELGQFQDRRFDIVFTDAVLIYIGRDKIKKVIQEMLRVTCRALILMEWHCFGPQCKDPNGLGVYHQGLWKRDYVALLKQFVPAEQMCVTKLTEDMWPEKNWKELGAIVEVAM